MYSGNSHYEQYETVLTYIKEKSSENMEDKFSDDLIKANYLTVIPVHTE
jgi:hypothetical protein